MKGRQEESFFLSSLIPHPSSLPRGCITMKLLLLAILGLGIGCIGGMVGIGGGVLLIPALTELFQVEPRKAAGMTLAAMVPPVTLPGAWRYYNQGFLSTTDLGLAACIAVTFALGAFLGA